MITLKQLVEQQKFTGINDVGIIRAFFDMNNMEEEGIELVHELTKSKIEKLNRRIRGVEEWTTNLWSKYLYENYDLDTADMLHKVELYYVSHGYRLSDWALEWAKENIPNIEKPKFYFYPVIEYLDAKGLRFKGEEPIEERDRAFSDYVNLEEE